MQVNVSREGKAETIDLDMTDITSKEMVRFQKLVGDEHTDDLLAGTIRPDLIDSLVFVKLKRLYPDLNQDDFDFSYTEALVEFGGGGDDDTGEA